MTAIDPISRIGSQGEVVPCFVEHFIPSPLLETIQEVAQTDSSYFPLRPHLTEIFGSYLAAFSSPLKVPAQPLSKELSNYTEQLRDIHRDLFGFCVSVVEQQISTPPVRIDIYCTANAVTIHVNGKLRKFKPAERNTLLTLAVLDAKFTFEAFGAIYLPHDPPARVDNVLLRVREAVPELQLQAVQKGIQNVGNADFKFHGGDKNWVVEFLRVNPARQAAK